MNLANGIHFNVSRADYDAIDRVNWSTLKILGRSPAHYRHAITTKAAYDSDVMALGRATHLAAFEPERLLSACAIWKGKVRNGGKWDTFEAANAEKEILTKAAFAKANTLGNAVRASVMAAPYVTGGKGEVTVLWTHKVPGMGAVPGFTIDCKCRLDFLANVGAIADLKSTADARARTFGRQVMNLEYHAQAAMQIDGFLAASGRELPYVWPVVETAAPHVVQVYTPTTQLLELGRARYRGLLDQLQVCRETNEWDGYAKSPMAVEVPAWALPDEEEVIEETMLMPAIGFGGAAQ